MKFEIDSMYKNQIYNLVEPIVGVNLSGCKWVFKWKTNMDGKVHTYKARLVSLLKYVFDFTCYCYVS